MAICEAPKCGSVDTIKIVDEKTDGNPSIRLCKEHLKRSQDLLLAIILEKRPTLLTMNWSISLQTIRGVLQIDRRLSRSTRPLN